MAYGLLYGSYDISVDEKNRMGIPAEIRQSIVPEQDSNVFVIVGHNGKIWIYSDKYYEKLVSQEPPELLAADEALEFDHLNFSAAYKVPLDKQYRVLLPDKLVKSTETGRVVTVIGSRDHLEVWNREECTAHLEALQQRRKEIADRKRKGSGQISPA